MDFEKAGEHQLDDLGPSPLVWFSEISTRSEADKPQPSLLGNTFVA